MVIKPALFTLKKYLEAELKAITSAAFRADVAYLPGLIQYLLRVRVQKKKKTESRKQILSVT